MADIELVIKIPKQVYNYIHKHHHIANSDILDIKDAIINGTPLPKGHGDLKDVEELKSAFIAWSTVVHGIFTDANIASVIYNSHTIIAADKEMKHADDN